MDRNVEIENRINKIKNYDRLHNINSYGGMGLSGLPEPILKLRLEEIDYMKKHSKIYYPPYNNPSIYLLPK